MAAHRAAAPGPVLEEPRPGLSLARNRALEWAPAGAALAFVDDDAVAGVGWWQALERHWADAGTGVACIGGPIRPRFAGSPPAWLSEPIMPVLTLLDLGRATRQELWPGSAHVGLPVLLPGGEEGRLLRFERSADGERWKWALEFRGLRHPH